MRRGNSGPGAVSAALLAASFLAGSAVALSAQTGPVIDSVLPAADTLVTDVDPQNLGMDFIYCIDWENPLLQFQSQKGVIGWRDPANAGAVVREDSTTGQNASGTCPSGWELGAFTSQFERGRYRVWYEIEIVDGNNAVHTDSVSVDSVFLFDVPPTLEITTPADSVQVTASPSIDALDASTNLGRSQLVRLIHRFRPEGGGASTVYRVDTLYTNANGIAALDAIPLDQGDGEYVLVAETDSLPIADDPPDLNTPARDQIVRRLNQSGPGITVILPASDSAHGPRFEVHGTSQPTARVTIDQCDGCSARGDTVVAGADSAWTFGTVDFPTTGTNAIRLIAHDTVAATNSPGIPDTATVTFDVVANQAPTVAILAPAQDTTILVGDSVRFRAEATDPDGDPVTVVWSFSPTDPTFIGSPPDSVVGADAGFVAFVPADTFAVSVIARDDAGATSTVQSRTVVVLPRGPNVDVTTPGSENRVDGHDVVFVIRAMPTDDPAADVDGDGVVDGGDLAAVRAAFGTLVSPLPDREEP